MSAASLSKPDLSAAMRLLFNCMSSSTGCARLGRERHDYDLIWPQSLLCGHSPQSFTGTEFLSLYARPTLASFVR